MHTIDIISDVSCPWCIIGYKSLQSAIKELGNDSDIQLSWRPFELNPQMAVEGQGRAEHIQQKYGLSPAQSKANRQNLIDRGLDVGYEFSFPDAGRVYNTFNAHRLLHWAKDYSLQTELKLTLFDLYFQQGGNPSDENALLACVEEVGLPVSEAREILQSNKYASEVRADEELSQRQGISAVPTFIFDNKYMVSGGQPKETFVNVLKELEKESEKQ